MKSADLFIFLVSTFLSDFEVFSNKRNDCPAQDSNPGPLACEASVLTIQLLPLLIEIMKTWEVILILVCFEILPLWLLPFLPTSF